MNNSIRSFKLKDNCISVLYCRNIQFLIRQFCCFSAVAPEFPPWGEKLSFTLPYLNLTVLTIFSNTSYKLLKCLHVTNVIAVCCVFCLKCIKDLLADDFLQLNTNKEVLVCTPAGFVPEVKESHGSLSSSPSVLLCSTYPL